MGADPGFVVRLGCSVAWVASVGACVANLAYTFGFEDDLLPLTYNSLAGGFPPAVAWM